MPIPASYLFRSRRSASLAHSLARFTPFLSTTRSTMKIVQSRLLGPLLSIFSIRFSSSLKLGGKAQAVVASSPLPAQRSAEPVLPEEKLKDEEFVWPAHQDSDYACSSIFCYNPLLQKTLEVGIKRDWRSMKLKKSSDEARREFDELMRRTMENPSRRDMEVYTAQNFEAADDIFEPSKPVDWTPNPQTLMQLRDGGIRSFALELNGIWPDLTKQTAKYVEQMPDRYAYIYVPNNHIVPGGNFTSFYYWDSYWIGKGLLASGMNDTAKGLLENFLSMVQRYGFVPNGGMVCYERRSQPPFLIPMVYDYVEATGDLEFVKDHIRTLDAEFSFWLKDRAMLLDIDGTSRRVLHYDGQAGNPRPERMKQDIFAGAMWTSSEDKKRFYRAVKSACESGWDFSSRWIIHNGTNVGNVSYTAATSIIPVDLQAFMVKNSLIMAKFHEQLGEEPQKQFYLDFHAEMCHNISVVFWNPETQMWGDYDSINMKRRPYYYLSNIAPLWAGCSGPNMTLDETAEAVVEYLRRNGALDYPGGVPVSTELTGEQWDFPNAWVPLTHLLYEALLQTNSKIAHEVAFSVANKTIKAGYEGYVKYGAMFEKYDVTNLGEPGGGGEYIVQKGFGWTNGAILDMIMRTNGSLQLQPMMKPTPTTGHAAPMLETAAARFSSSKAANFMAVAFLMAFAVGLSVWTTWKVMTKKTSALSWDDYDGIGKKYKRNSRDETAKMQDLALDLGRELARLQSDTDETSDGI